MKQAKSKGELDSLQSIFADVTTNARKDPIERIVVLTYEFDDQQLVNLIAGRLLDDDFTLRTNHLRFIAGCQPVVLYDARKTREFNQLPHFLELIPVRAAPYSCHHSKAYLIVTRHSVRLVLGSFNLTQTGLFSNREVFMDFLWSDRACANVGVLRSFAGLLRAGYANHPQAASSAALESVVVTIERRLSHWKNLNADAGVGEDAYTLLASGYGHEGAETGLQQLAALWHSVSDQPPRKLVVVSPFFDRGRTFLVDALGRELGPIAEIELYTDADNVAMLSKRHYGTHATTRRLHLIPKAIGSTELARIAAANGDMPLGDLCIARKLHAKVLILCGDGGRHLVYIGSANFTSKAWNGDNHELGLVWTEEGDADRIIVPVLRALGPSAICSFAALPERLDENDGEQDVLYGEEPGYPDFIERIELRSEDEMATARFHFSCAAPERLQDYEIRWGDVLITPLGSSSQPIRWDASAVPLLGKRNLRFVRNGSVEPAFFLPFYHAAELLEYADLVLFQSSEDWLRHYLRPYDGGGSGEHIPGEAPEAPDVPTASIDRENNVVITMQRYLTLFAEVENVFATRVAEIAKLPDCAEQWARRVQEPLALYARLLDKEREKSTSVLCEQVHSFKLGELALFCNSLGAQLPNMGAFARHLAAGLVPRSSQPAVLKTYLEFCQGEVK
jgi:hypothetical protein